MKTIFVVAVGIAACAGCTLPGDSSATGIRVISEYIAPAGGLDVAQTGARQVAGAEAVAAEVELLHRSAREKFTEGGDTEGAIRDLTSALSLGPGKAQKAAILSDLSSLYTFYAKGLMRAKETGRACEFFKKALQTDSSNASSHYEYGIALEKLGKDTDALREYEQAIRLRPGYYEVYNSRGWLRYVSGKYEEALKDFNRALLLYPDYGNALINKGILLEKMDKPEEAFRLYEKAVELAPASGLAHNNRGWAYLKQKKFDAAIEDFTHAIKLDAGLDVAYLNRANAYFEAGMEEAAVAAYEEFLRTFPSHPRASEIETWLKTQRKGRR